MGRPSVTRGRKSMTYYAGTIGVPDAASPQMLNKSWTITADIDVPASDANGMIVTHGGLEGGYGLYLRDGKATFVYNYLSLERPTFVSKSPIPKGKVKLVVKFDYNGGGMGKGGMITMTANGTEIAKGRLERTVPVQYTLGEGLDLTIEAIFITNIKVPSVPHPPTTPHPAYNANHPKQGKAQQLPIPQAYLRV